jgi:hypothetical protein
MKMENNPADIVLDPVWSVPGEEAPNFNWPHKRAIWMGNREKPLVNV